jgi:hypothetical protein
MLLISYRVGPTAVGSHPREKEQVLEVCECPQPPSFMDTNTLPEQGTPRCVPIQFLLSLYYRILYLFLYYALTYRSWMEL